MYVKGRIVVLAMINVYASDICGGSNGNVCGRENCGRGDGMCEVVAMDNKACVCGRENCGSSQWYYLRMYEQTVVCRGMGGNSNFKKSSAIIKDADFSVVDGNREKCCGVVPRYVSWIRKKKLTSAYRRAVEVSEERSSRQHLEIEVRVPTPPEGGMSRHQSGYKSTLHPYYTDKRN
ncbi:hypothetical protein AVEN_139270-1 [Araneus ventricosus]|uniref:EB domain-containing protein n=1 Tax=Araneus ventricosus TaxID=182803 RepID=A0A4Y2MCG8_ARAVE|nr:hypothetical protein AVEN_139270-1 [Araneus ventricosus]